MTPQPANVREFAQRYTAAWCSHDGPERGSLLLAEWALSINGGTPAVGRSAITAAAQEFMSAFPDLQVLMDDLQIKGHRAVYHWTLIGTNNGLGGTGHRVRISGFEQWEFSGDGLIARSQGCFDNADYRRQLENGFEGSL
jgi:predicted ester cyclase